MAILPERDSIFESIGDKSTVLVAVTSTTVHDVVVAITDQLLRKFGSIFDRDFLTMNENLSRELEDAFDHERILSLYSSSFIQSKYVF